MTLCLVGVSVNVCNNYLHSTTAVFQGRQFLIVPGDLLLRSRHSGLESVHISLRR